MGKISRATLTKNISEINELENVNIENRQAVNNLINREWIVLYKILYYLVDEKVFVSWRISTVQWNFNPPILSQFFL